MRGMNKTKRLKEHLSFGFVFLLAVLAFNMGCTFKQKHNGEWLQKTENDTLSFYDTPYTYVEELEDGSYNFFIYASPVQWNDGATYVPIDNKIVGTKRKGYSYENASNQIKTYFPSNENIGFLLENGGDYFYMEIPEITGEGKTESFHNIYGQEKEAIEYQLKNGGVLYVYPVNTGIHFECVFEDGITGEDTLSMIIKKQRMRSNEISDEYLQFFQREMKLFLYQPLIRNNDEEATMENIWELKEKDSNDNIFVEMHNIPQQKGKVQLEFSLLWDVEVMPDSTVYEKKDENVFCARSAIIGQGKNTGIGLHYLRYRLTYFFQINPEDILESYYYIKNLNGTVDTGNPSLHEPSIQWSSTRICWPAKVTYSEDNQNGGVNLTEEGWYEFDITDFTINAFEDFTGLTESIGSVITCDEGYIFFATSDNGEFSPYIKIHIKNLPEYFMEHESINEVDW